MSSSWRCHQSCPLGDFPSSLGATSPLYLSLLEQLALLVSVGHFTIVQRILTGKASNAVQATHFINTIISTPVSSRTVRNILKETSLKAMVKKRKPLLSVSHRKRRLAFALKYQHWTVEDWKRVLWSDETKINRIGSDGQEYVWKRKGEGLTSREIPGTVKFGGGSLMVWGYIGWNGVGVLSEVEGRMDAEQYVAILEGGLLQSMEDSEFSADEVIF